MSVNSSLSFYTLGIRGGIRGLLAFAAVFTGFFARLGLLAWATIIWADFIAVAQALGREGGAHSGSGARRALDRQAAGSGPNLMPVAVIARLPVTASGHLGNPR